MIHRERYTLEKLHFGTNEKLKKLYGSYCCLPAFSLIDDFYGEEHRYYHNRKHIIDLVEYVSEFSAYTGMTEEESVFVEVALWFHDIIYQPKQNNNETRSAELAAYLMPNFTDYKIKESIMQTILHTTHFEKDSHELPNWSKYVLDVDLMGLGSAYYQENTVRLRLENSHVNDEIFDKRRIAFLKKVLKEKQPIYYNPYRLQLFESLNNLAKENIENDINRLMAREYHP